MSLALLHALARPLGLRAKGLNDVAQAALRLAAASRNSYAAARRDGLWEVSLLRCCSGDTNFRQRTRFPGAHEEEDDRTRKVLSPHSPKTVHQSDLSNSASPDDFLLPSQYQRYQSDLLETKINECESVSYALEIYQRHKDVMDTRHCLALIKNLSELVTSGTESCTHLLQSEDFEELSRQLFRQCRRMEVDELVSLIKYLCRLEVPSDAKLMQTVLQMVKNQINDLSLRQVIFLDFLLRKLPLTPLSDALLTAIPILLSKTVTTKPLEDLSTAELSQAYAICCHGNVEGSGILVQEMYNRGSVKSVTMARRLVLTLIQKSNPRRLSKFMTPDQQLTRDVIVKECLETLAREAYTLTSEEIDFTLSRISESHLKGDKSCYNERFLQAVASHCCQTSASFEYVSHTLRKMLKMNYISEELVHYAVQRIIARPEEVPEARITITVILSALAASRTVTKYDLKQALDIIMTHKTLQMDSEEYHKKPLLLIAVDLLSAGYFYPPLMKILTSADTLSIFMSKYPKDDVNYRRLVMVDQALSEIFNSPCRVPEAFLEPGKKVLATLPPTRSTLRAMLLQILKNPSCLVSGVLTEGGTYIDHFLALDSEGVPMSLRNDDDDALIINPSIASLGVPADATKVAILDLGSAMAFRPSNALQGHQRLRQSILEASGFKVQPILQSVIYQHKDEEKLLYLKRELNTGAGVVFS